MAGARRENWTSGLPLRYRTPAAWATHALADANALLNDHAHLEKKAAANALDLLHRWPEAQPPPAWIAALTAIARDEVEHLATVTRLLARRGGSFDRVHRNDYAAALRKQVRLGRGPAELVDRLMVSALIEARSCERFELLMACPEAPTPLAKLYAGLCASEAGHYRVFIELAQTILPESQVQQRWEQWLDCEAQIIARQAPGPRMHAGAPPG